MAAPTLDSENPPTGAVPPAGPGSKTPVPPIGGGGDLGGAPPIKPTGAPGAPNKDKGKDLEPLDEDTFQTLIDDTYQAIDDSKVKSETVDDVVNYLLNNTWSEKRLLELSKYLKTSIRNMIHSIMKHVKEEGPNETFDLIKKKIKKLNKEEEKEGEGALPPPPIGMPPLPPLGAKASNNNRILTDVNLDKNNTRGFNKMGKIILKEGAVMDSAAYTKEIISNLSSGIRKVRASISEYETAKLNYAGILSLKKAAMGDMPGGGLGAEKDDMGGAMPPAPDMGPEKEEGDGDLGKIEEGIEKIEDQLEEILDKMDEGIGSLKEDKEKGEDILEKEEGPEEDLEKLTAKINDAKIVIAEAKKAKGEKGFGEFNKFFKGEGKEKGKGKEDKKDGKKEDKEDKKEKKEGSDVEGLLGKIRARIEELRSEKEANLYPFKKEVKPIPPVDNINAETAKSQISTADSEIKGQPATDKEQENMNHGDIGQADLAYKTKGKNVSGKKVSVETAEKVRKHSVQNTADKAKLSVELAARQQLKGLIADPLKEALVKNLVEAGVESEAADAIIHNAYVDAYEESHQLLIKEAFDTFMNKEFDEFVKIAKFVDSYEVKTANTPVKEEDTEDFKEKEASTSAPLRGFSSDKDKGEVFKGYWKDVQAQHRAGNR